METTDPWFVAFMVLFSLLGISGLMYMGYIPRVAGTGAATAAGDIASAIITFLSNFLPFALFTFGFMSDVVHLEWRASIPSVAGLGAIVLLKVVSMFTNFGLTRSDNSATSWCTIPGLEVLENPFLPMAFVLTSTVLFYYSYWTGYPGSPSTNVFAIVAGIIFSVQMSSFYLSGNCKDYYYLTPNVGVAGNVVLSALLGAIVAGIAFGSAIGSGGDAMNPYLRGASSTGASGGQLLCPNGDALKFDDKGVPYCEKPPGPKCPDGTTPFPVTVNGKQVMVCPAPVGATTKIGQSMSTPTVGADGDIFVLADLYKNGQPVTDSLGK